MPIDWSNRLIRAEIVTFALTFLGNLLVFIALITPAWQVAEDSDAGRYVQSGLWMYCPGGAQCWYIFSDNLINYYEKVDICRFLLVGDCRKKLIRTPYFFGWHYAVLILVMLVLLFGIIAACAISIAVIRPARTRLLTITFDSFIFLAFFVLAIALAVFMINAEMLESRYLIGVKNTFEKEYGYSYYLAGLAMLIYLLAMLAGVMLTTKAFFTKSGRNFISEQKERPRRDRRGDGLKTYKGVSESAKQRSHHVSLPVIPVFENVFDQPPRPGNNTPVPSSITPNSNSDFPSSNTRTFLSY